MTAATAAPALPLLSPAEIDAYRQDEVEAAWAHARATEARCQAEEQTARLAAAELQHRVIEERLEMRRAANGGRF